MTTSKTKIARERGRSAVGSAAGAAGLLALGAGGFAYASLWPRSQIFGPVVVAPRRPGEFALTFDDGPNPAATPALLELLARHGVRASFFLIGENVRREPALARAIAAAGHDVGNHTMTHPWLTFKSERRVRAELGDTNRLLEDTLGQRVEMFRPPHGARRPAVLRVALELGLKTVQWNVIANDWEPVSAAVIGERIARGVRSVTRRGSAVNLVLHDGGHGTDRRSTIVAVETLLERNEGWRWVTPETWSPG